MNREPNEATLTVIDGREALAYLVILPGENDNVLVDAAANGISRVQAAYLLRQIADRWDPPQPEKETQIDAR